jgi:L-fucose isomerase-like protein
VKKKFLLGVCPVGKFVFSHEDAVRQKKAIFRKLDQWGVSYCTIDGVLPDGLVRDQKHVEPVVAFLRTQNVDALFVPHCNFGTEGAVGMIAKRLGVPVLLWGPRDEAPLGDGSRLRDSLCGMFASSKVLRKLGVPFTYVENCSVEDGKFREGVSLFLRAARVVSKLRHLTNLSTVGRIGKRVTYAGGTDRLGENWPLRAATPMKFTMFRAARRAVRFLTSYSGTISTKSMPISAPLPASPRIRLKS